LIGPTSDLVFRIFNFDGADAIRQRGRGTENLKYYFIIFFSNGSGEMESEPDKYIMIF
jgi:hypothetical protein